MVGFKKRTSKPKGNGSKGNFMPRTNVIVNVANSEAIQLNDAGKMVSLTGTLVNSSLEQYSDKHAAGTEVTIVLPGKKDAADRIQNHVKDNLEKYTSKSNFDLIIEDAYIGQDGNIVAGYINNWGRTALKKGQENPDFLTRPDEFMQVRRGKTANGNGYMSVSSFKVDNAMALFGPGADEVKAKIAELAQAMSEDAETMNDPFYADWVGRAQRLDELSSLEKLGVIYDMKLGAIGTADDPVDDFHHPLVNSTYSLGIRGVQVPEDGEFKDEDFHFVQLYGKNQEVEGGQYVPLTFADMLVYNLNSPLSMKDGDNAKFDCAEITYEEVLEQGVAGVMERFAVEEEFEDENGETVTETVYGNGRTDKIVEFFSLMEALDEDPEAVNVMIEAFGVPQYSVGKKTAEKSNFTTKKMIDPFEFQIGERSFERNGKTETVPTLVNRVVRGDVAFTMVETQSSDDERYIVSKLVSHGANFGIPHQTFVPARLPSPNLAKMDGAMEFVTSRSKADAEAFSKKAKAFRMGEKDNSNDNENDNSGVDHDAENHAPGM